MGMVRCAHGEVLGEEQDLPWRQHPARPHLLHTLAVKDTDLGDRGEGKVWSGQKTLSLTLSLNPNPKTLTLIKGT